MRFGFLKPMLYGLAFLLVVACHPQPRLNNELMVGVIAGPEAQLVEMAKEIAKAQGLQVTIVAFEDYAMPNRALAEGDIDLNVFQHLPYLEAAMAQLGYDFVPIGKTFIYPMGLYSEKLKTLNELGTHAVIGIPNDPSNQARALQLLEQQGLLRLNSQAQPSIQQIADNPKQFNFVELDAALLPRALKDLDLAAINTNYALAATLSPQQALALESKDSPYANLIVARRAEKDLPKYQTFIAAMHDPKVLALAETLFKGHAIVAW